MSHKVKKRKRIVHIHPKNDVLDELSDYTISNVNKDKVVMRYGNIGWADSVIDTKAVTMVDNQNGYDITFNFDDHHIHLDYSEINQLYAMLTFYQEHSKLDDNPMNFEFLKPIK